MKTSEQFKKVGLVLVMLSLIAGLLTACGGDQPTPASQTSPAGAPATNDSSKPNASATVAAALTEGNRSDSDATTPGVKTGAGNSSVAGDLPIYPGSKQVNTARAQSGAALVSTTYYTSSDKAEDIYKWATPAFQDKGWTLTTSANDASAQAYVLNGTRTGKSLVLTIVGPQARSQAKYADLFQKTGAGPNDSLIFVVVTGA